MSDRQDYSTIRVERLGRVERITLNRPEKRNAMSFELQDELVEEIKDAERSNDVRCIVIRGCGPSFCSGYDITPGSADSYRTPMTVEEDVALLRDIADRWARVRNCRIPVIAQVHGYCVAGGTDLALHCDMVVAADDALIGFPPVRAQGGPPTHMWIYNAGPQWTKRLLLAGDLISGSKAAEVGFVLEAVPADQVRRPCHSPGHKDRDHRQGPTGSQQADCEPGSGTNGPKLTAGFGRHPRRTRPPGAGGGGVQRAARQRGGQGGRCRARRRVPVDHFQ
jgi:enoyl-CoA hydratase/carnithine racemase